MKKALFISFLLILICSGCTRGEADFTIKVSGTEGMRFSANLGGADMVSGPSGESFQDTVPAEYGVDGSVIGFTFQKLAAEGTLEVQVIRNGNVIFSSGTNEAQGVVIGVASKD